MAFGFKRLVPALSKEEWADIAIRVGELMSLGGRLVLRQVHDQRIEELQQTLTEVTLERDELLKELEEKKQVQNDKSESGAN